MNTCDAYYNCVCVLHMYVFVHGNNVYVCLQLNKVQICNLDHVLCSSICGWEYWNLYNLVFEATLFKVSGDQCFKYPLSIHDILLIRDSTHRILTHISV